MRFLYLSLALISLAISSSKIVGAEITISNQPNSGFFISGSITNGSFLFWDANANLNIESLVYEMERRETMDLLWSGDPGREVSVRVVDPIVLCCSEDKLLRITSNADIHIEAPIRSAPGSRLALTLESDADGDGFGNIYVNDVLETRGSQVRLFGHSVRMGTLGRIIAGANHVLVFTEADAVLTGILSSMNSEFAIRVHTRTGKLLDGGNARTDLSAPSGGVFLNLAGGTGIEPVELNTRSLIVESTLPGDARFRCIDDVRIDRAVLAAGNIEIGAGSFIETRETFGELRSGGGSIVLNAGDGVRIGAGSLVSTAPGTNGLLENYGADIHPDATIEIGTGDILLVADQPVQTRNSTWGSIKALFR